MRLRGGLGFCRKDLVSGGVGSKGGEEVVGSGGLGGVV